ncbi:hypothetical protein MM440_12330 [Arsenicicoccus piscis]|uniref:FtsK/SpoIIIE domain-containing protein n=1 Tax=Arsenicicoccus piscis TaxID=673954 RepID=UPI001F4C7C62|nr:hypothetical protein [Arsenicicoccus piscis]
MALLTRELVTVVLLTLVWLLPGLVMQVAGMVAPRQCHAFEVWWRARRIARAVRAAWPGLSRALDLGEVAYRTVKADDGARSKVEHWVPAQVWVDASPVDAVLTIRVPRGLSSADIRAKADAIGADLGAVAVHDVPAGPGLVALRCIFVDVLATARAWPAAVGVVAPVVGRGEDGSPVCHDWRTPTHMAVQGSTRSGKSVLSYALLGSLAGREDVAVVGVDPSGLLLGPWQDLGRFPGLIACGTADMGGAVDVLGHLVDVMDDRVRRLRASGADKIDVFTVDDPLLVVVVEELPGARRAVKDQGGTKLLAAFDSQLGRLVAEGAKVGVRVLVLGQRLSAASIDTDSRSNFSAAITLRVDSSEALRMLHSPDVAARFGSECGDWSPGVGVVTLPGAGTRRFRADLTSYEQYRAAVRLSSPADAMLGLPVSVHAPALRMVDDLEDAAGGAA